MHLPYATLLLVLTPACVAAPADPNDPIDPIDPPTTPATCAPADQPGHTIVACGFGPALALAAIDDASVYAVSSQHTLYGVDLHTAAVTRLYHSLDAYAALPTLASGIVAHDHALFFPGMVELGGGFTYGILSIAADHPTTTARVVMIADAYEPIAPVIDDGS
ncbi:MAG: hypothetical protein NT062_39140, partial [Proteobacteria bacterium]|nr:hypothetical protein [Pseudomonadota bacterium]